MYMWLFSTLRSVKNPAAQSGEGVRRSTNRRLGSSGQSTWNTMRGLHNLLIPPKRFKSISIFNESVSMACTAIASLHNTKHLDLPKIAPSTNIVSKTYSECIFSMYGPNFRFQRS